MAQAEAHRQRLLDLAYRMVGSMAEAEDLVQDALLRLEQTPGVQHPSGWLRRTLTRLCIDHQRSARVRRERYVGPWLPEPVRAPAPDPVELAESLSMAFLVLLEQLSPAERAAFLLREVFDEDYSSIARTLERRPAACRQLVRRARAHLRERRRRRLADPETHARLLQAFTRATLAGDREALLDLLGEEVELVSDGGGRVPAATRVLRGPEKVAALLLGLARKAPPGLQLEWAEINGEPGLILRQEDLVIQATCLELQHSPDGPRIAVVRTMRNPEKLTRL